MKVVIAEIFDDVYVGRLESRTKYSWSFADPNIGGASCSGAAIFEATNRLKPVNVIYRWNNPHQARSAWSRRHGGALG